jgi:hypothetical protein
VSAVPLNQRGEPCYAGNSRRHSNAVPHWSLRLHRIAQIGSKIVSDLEGRGDGIEVGTCSGEERSFVSPLRLTMLRTGPATVSTSLQSKSRSPSRSSWWGSATPRLRASAGRCVYPRVGTARCPDGACKHPVQGCTCEAATAPLSAGHFFFGCPCRRRGSFSSLPLRRARIVGPLPVGTRDQRGKLRARVRCSSIGHRVVRLRPHIVSGDTFG